LPGHHTKHGTCSLQCFRSRLQSPTPFRAGWVSNSWKKSVEKTEAPDAVRTCTAAYPSDSLWCRGDFWHRYSPSAQLAARICAVGPQLSCSGELPTCKRSNNTRHVRQKSGHAQASLLHSQALKPVAPWYQCVWRQQLMRLHFKAH
jgi:hypothetical protein